MRARARTRSAGEASEGLAHSPSEVVEVRQQRRSRPARRQGGLGGVRLQAATQFVPLREGRGVRVLGDRQSTPDGIQPHEVGVDGIRVGGHWAQGRDVGHGKPRRRHDLCDTPRLERADRGTTRLELCAKGTGAGLVVGVGPPGGRTDDEVTFGACALLLEGAEQAPDVSTALGAGRHVGEPGVEALEGGARGLSTDGALALDEVANPFDRGAQRPQARLDVGLGGVEAEPGAQGSGEGVAEAAGLGQRDRQRSPGGDRPPRGRGVESSPDQGGQPLELGRADAARVPRRHEEVVPVGHSLPQRHRQQQVTRVRRPVTRGEGRLVDVVELALALLAPGAEGAEVLQRVLRLQRLPESTGRPGCGGLPRHGDHGFRP